MARQNSQIELYSNMKKEATFIPYHTILLFAIFFSNPMMANPMPPPPPGLQTPPPVSIDLYMIPMIVIGIIYAFIFIKKNTPI